MAPLQAQLFDVGAGRFGDPQPIQSQQAHERVIAGAGESGADEQGTDFVAVQARGIRFVVEVRTPNVHRGRDREQSFLFGVAVEARDRAQPPRDGRTRSSQRFEMATEAFNVGATGTEQRDAMFCAPLDVLTTASKRRPDHVTPRAPICLIEWGVALRRCS